MNHICPNTKEVVGFFHGLFKLQSKRTVGINEVTVTNVVEPMMTNAMNEALLQDFIAERSTCSSMKYT